MTGKEYIDSVMYDLGKIQVLTTDTNLRTMILNWANRVLKDISSRESHWYWLEKTAEFSTVANQMSYDYPTDIQGRRIISLKQKTSPAKIVFIDQRTLDLLEPKPNSYTGTPIYYTTYANAIRLVPVPSSVITIYMRYVKKITELSDSSASTTNIPAMFDNVVIDGIKKQAYSYYPELGKSTEAKLDYEKGIVYMKSDNANFVDDDQVSYAHGVTSDSMVQPYHFDNTNVG